MMDLDEIIAKYEVPGEFFDALADAYEAGAKRGFMAGAIGEL
jgi:hypothetical protein